MLILKLIVIMNTIEAYEYDINCQLEEIPNMVKDMKTNYKVEEEQERCIFCGLGDSYAASLLAVYASNHKARFIDPLEIALKPSLVKDSILYIISVSGSTRANIEAARATQGICKRIAITHNPNSKLASICDDVIELKYNSSNIFTAGSISFVASCIATLSIVNKLDIKKDISDIYNAAKNSLLLTNHTYIVGMGITYPLSIYATAKIYEILGYKAQYSYLEEFLHTQIFSLNNKDTLIILSDLDKAYELYNKIDCNKYIIKPYSSNLLENILYYIFFIQLMVLYNARYIGLEECYFIKNKTIREISSSLIY